MAEIAPPFALDADPQTMGMYPYGSSTAWGGRLVLIPNIEPTYVPGQIEKTEAEKVVPGAMGDVMQLARVLQEAVVMTLVR
jgi:hypothetical protein